MTNIKHTNEKIRKYRIVQTLHLCDEHYNGERVELKMPQCEVEILPPDTPHTQCDKCFRDYILEEEYS